VVSGDPEIGRLHPFGRAVHLRTAATLADPGALAARLAGRGLPGAEVERIEPSLEDVFLGWSTPDASGATPVPAVRA